MSADVVEPVEAERASPADVASEDERIALEELIRHAAATAEELPTRIESAVDEGVRTAAATMGDNLAQIRTSVDEVIRRVGALESGAEGERHTRIEELAALVDVVSSGCTTLERRFTRVEALVEALGHALDSRSGGIVYRIDDRPAQARHLSLRLSAPSQPRSADVDDVARQRRVRARKSDVSGFVSRLLRQKAA